MGVEEFENSPSKKDKLEEKTNEGENDEPNSETETPQEETVEEEETVDDEKLTKNEVESDDDDVKEEPNESPPVENGESSTPLTEVHENGQENLKDPEEPALKKELVNGTVKEPAENELNRFIEEDSNDSQEEIRSSNKKIDLRNFLNI